MRGRKPLPTELKLLMGNPGKRPINKNEPKPDGMMPSCPKWLSKGARIHWRRLAPQLFNMGVLTRLDGEALGAFCDCLERYVEAVEFLEKNGSVIVVRNDKGEFKFTQAAPQVGIAAKMLDQMTRIGSEFGWSPASRARLSVKGSDRKSLAEIAAERAAKVRGQLKSKLDHIAAKESCE
jgi:P27 family predicted phage terminase small subunit